MKYWNKLSDSNKDEKDNKHTCEVHTLLKLTKVIVWTNQAKGKPDGPPPKRKPDPRDKPICGKNDSSGLDPKDVEVWPGVPGYVKYVP